jgi:hypothetical protein
MAVKNTWLDGETVRATDLNALASEANSGVKRIVTTISTTTTLVAQENTDYVILVSGGSVTLPTAVGNTSRITIKNVSSSSRLVDGSGTQTIDDSQTISLPPDHSIDLVSNGSNWVVI